MLTKFSVTNFKGFNSEFTLNLDEANGYNFNKNSVENGVVKNSIIYGKNGVGKSNLGLAIYDLIGHLTDLHSNEKNYTVYLNAKNKKSFAEFKYEFLINTKKIKYQYRKSDYKTIISEKFYIDNKLLASINRNKDDNASIKLKGTKNLKKKVGNSNLSILKYIRNNTVLDENIENNVFNEFFKFIDGMLFFRSLHKNMFIGLEFGNSGIEEDIIEKGNVLNLQSFLNKAGIECKLVEVNRGENSFIAFDFNNKFIPFVDVASTGTKSLILFYYWFQRLKKSSRVSLLFIDEFDAFYHHGLSTLIVEELKQTGVQFILTTHNTSILSNDLLRPDCYFLMTKSEIKSFAKNTSKELREAHNIEKMYKAGSFNAK